MKRQPYEDNSPWQTTYGSAYNVNHYPNNDIIFNNALDNQVNPPYQNIPQNKNLYRNIHGELESLNDSTEYFINKAKSVKQYFYIEYQNPEFRNYMEDKGKSFDCFTGFSQALFCLYDGHQNDSISSYLQDNFHNEFRTLLKITNNQFTKQNIYDLFAKIDLILSLALNSAFHKHFVAKSPKNPYSNPSRCRFYRLHKGLAKVF